MALVDASCFLGQSVSCQGLTRGFLGDLSVSLSGIIIRGASEAQNNKTDGVKGQHAAFIALARIGIQVPRKD